MNYYSMIEDQREREDDEMLPIVCESLSFIHITITAHTPSPLTVQMHQKLKYQVVQVAIETENAPIQYGK